MWWTACDSLKPLATLVEGNLVTDACDPDHRPPLRVRLGRLPAERARGPPGLGVAGPTSRRAVGRLARQDRRAEATRDDGCRDPDRHRLYRLRGGTRRDSGPAHGWFRQADRGRGR